MPTDSLHSGVPVAFLIIAKRLRSDAAATFAGSYMP